MKTQQLFLASYNRDSGSASDLYFTFPNGLVKETSTASVQPRTSIELAEFSIPRLWWDVQVGINDTFRVTNTSTTASFIITIPQGWYTVGQDTLSSGVAIEPVLTNLLTTIVGAGAWTVAVAPLSGVFNFTTPTVTGGAGFSFDFLTQNNRCAELLGFYKLNNYISVNNVIGAPKPFRLQRTHQLVIHTDIQQAFAQGAIDNYGGTARKNFDNSDILAVIPIDQPPRGILNYQSTEKINRIWIKPEEIRTLRVFISDDKGVQIDFTNCEWTAVLRVVYGDNLSV